MRLCCKPKHISPGTCRLTGTFWTEVRLDPESEWAVWKLQRKLCWIFKHIVWDLLIRHTRCGSGNMAVYASVVWCKKKKKKKGPPTVMGGATSAKSLCCFTASREPGDERPNPESVSKVRSISYRNIIVHTCNSRKRPTAKWVIKSKQQIKT